MRSFCCNKQRSTRFCPDCGKELEEDSSLRGLVKRCRATESGLRTQIESVLMDAETSGKTKERRANNLAANADKWKCWGDLLEKVLASQ